MKSIFYSCQHLNSAGLRYSQFKHDLKEKVYPKSKLIWSCLYGNNTLFALFRGNRDYTTPTSVPIFYDTQEKSHGFPQSLNHDSPDINDLHYVIFIAPTGKSNEDRTFVWGRKEIDFNLLFKWKATAYR